MPSPPARSWTYLTTLAPSPLGLQSKAVVEVQTWLLCSPLRFSEPLYCLPRYKDNPFSLGESFGSRWDTDTAWGMDRMDYASRFDFDRCMDRMEEKEPEVTVSSIRPVSERWRPVP